ncbi:MAG TPA: metal ABC transporter permease [Acidimicrobiales bacterium]|jgi:zinc/manganese transport system permease protein|nr:metal ABC transporter permease [Acidimicrobiales bacterium]
MSVLAAHLASGDPIAGIGHMLALPFEVRAYVAGTLIAAAAGLVGYFVVLRSQVFTGDALSHVAFTGALAALAAGIDLRVGLFAACVIFGVAISALGRAGRPDDIVIGNVFAWILGLGALFLTVYTTGASGTAGGNNAGSGVNVLFGSIFGLTNGQTTTAAVIAAGVIVAVVAIARPLMFASIDAVVAAARGLPVRALGTGFLILAGITAGEATQAVGALLILGLLATPAATAQRLTTRPFRALWASAGIAVASIWIGLAISYASSSVPPSFAILAVSTGMYVVTLTATTVTSRRLSSVPGYQGER